MSNRWSDDNVSIDLNRVNSMEVKVYHRDAGQLGWTNCRLFFYLKDGNVVKTSEGDCETMRARMSLINDKLEKKRSISSFQ